MVYIKRKSVINEGFFQILEFWLKKDKVSFIFYHKTLFWNQQQDFF
jgi:hypothetical protein